jgi:hypothetical protein
MLLRISELEMIQTRYCYPEIYHLYVVFMMCHTILKIAVSFFLTPPPLHTHTLTLKLTPDTHAYTNVTHIKMGKTSPPKKISIWHFEKGVPLAFIQTYLL